MERKLCHECKAENVCKYEGYINNTTRRINSFLGQAEKQEVLGTISYLKFRAATKSDPCPRYSELEMISIPTVVLDKNEGQKPKRSTKQASPQNV